MKSPENNVNDTSDLQTFENELALTAQEKAEFKKLPKKERERRNQESLEELTALNAKQTEIIKEATETGDLEKLEEAKVIKRQIEKGIQDLEEQVDINEAIPKIPKPQNKDASWSQQMNDYL